jgi:hypothetical protein
MSNEHTGRDSMQPDMKTYAKEEHKTLILKRLIKPWQWMEHMKHPVTRHTQNKQQQHFL